MLSPKDNFKCLSHKNWRRTYNNRSVPCQLFSPLLAVARKFQLMCDFVLSNFSFRTTFVNYALWWREKSVSYKYNFFRGTGSADILMNTFLSIQFYNERLMDLLNYFITSVIKKNFSSFDWCLSKTTSMMWSVLTLIKCQIVQFLENRAVQDN